MEIRSLNRTAVKPDGSVAEYTAKCAFCGADVEVVGRVGRQEECPACRRDLHACLQCRLYDRSYHNQCREPQAAYVADKERSNFCEFFEFGRDAVSERERAEASKRKLEELFQRKG